MTQDLRKKRRGKVRNAKQARQSIRPKCVKPFSAGTGSSPTVAAPVPTATTVTYPRPNLPRLVFEGKFFTDPSTTNNNIERYDVNRFRPSFQLRNDSLNQNGSWNPAGTATFSFVDCSVTGSYSTSAMGAPAVPDTLVGQPVQYNRQTVYGKISDLDPQMQTVSMLFGVRVNIGVGDESISTTLLPTSFRDLWGAIYNPNSEGAAYIQGVCGVWQGLLRIDAVNANNSTFLAECAPFLDQSKLVLGPDGQPLYPNGALSIRFRADWYDNDPTSSTFNYGNTTAFIQPWLPGNPLNFDAGRQLATVPNMPPNTANIAYAYVQKMTDGTDSLFVDLANSLYRTLPDTYADQGVIEVGYYPNGYTADPVPDFVPLKEVVYKEFTFEAASCVLDIPLSATHLAAIENAPLGLRAVAESGAVTYLLAEANDGFFTRADTYAYRLEPATSPAQVQDVEQSASLYCTCFGRRAATQAIIVGFDSSGMIGTGEGIGGPLPGRPASALTINGATALPDDPSGLQFSTTITTGSDGVATLNFFGTDCGNPRGYIDGQVYALRYDAGDQLPPVDPGAPNNEKINILLFNVFDFPVDGTPSWVVNVLPIFQQYANLYPAMDRIVRLDDFGSVSERRAGLVRVFSAGEEDPAYMPTTRDLSPAKRAMLLKFLTNTDAEGDLIFMNRAEPDVKAALQAVIELEHATMPPYLTAMFSIKPGYNRYIRDALKDVVYEEMLHFAIACNILTAIGGAPVISKMAFVPKFPSTLPGGLRSGLIVRLRKCTKEQVAAFMAIEAPEEQYLLEGGESTPDNPLQTNKYTIGWLYDEISAALEELNPGVIKFPDDTGVPDTDPTIANQVVDAFGDRLFTIRSLADAQRAIMEIKEEGEGSPASNNPSEGTIDPDTGLPKLAHYFRFAEIVKGRRLTVNTTEGTYAFNGPRIDLDMDGVYNMQDDPKIEKQPLDSLQRERMESFANKYEALLSGLERTFTGHPEALQDCLGQMFQLTIAAQPLMEMPALNEDGTEKADGTTCGVSFQVPVIGDSII